MSVDWGKVEVKPALNPNINYRRTLRVDLTLNPNMFYLLGSLKGDGCVGRYCGGYAIIFINSSESVLGSVELSMNKIGLNPRIVTDYNVPRLISFSKNFLEFYNSLSYPDLGKFVESSDDGRDCALSFIRGFYETEGCYVECSGQPDVRIGNTDLGLVDFSCKLMDFLSYRYSIYSKKLKSGKVYYTIRVLGGKKGICRFLDDVSPCIKRGE